MRWIVSYDIADDQRRRQVARHLEGIGLRVQYSVFECQLTPRQMRAARAFLVACIETEKDSIRWYPLPTRQLGRVIELGASWRTADGDGYFLV